MVGLARSAYLGEVTKKVAESNPAVGIEELDRRVLCVGFRCIFVAQCVFKWLKGFSLSSEGECIEGEHNVSSFAAYTKSSEVSRP